MLFLSVRGFSDYAGPKRPLAICAAAVLPSSYSEWSRHPDLRAFRSSIAPPTDASVYASSDTSRCPQQDSRSGWIRYFLSCRALASPTTCRFIPALCGVEMWRGGVGAAYRLPALSSAGASLASPCFRFHIPLIEPDGRISRFRL